MNRGLLVGMVVAALAGCATRPVSTSEARSVNPSSSFGQAQQGEPSGRLIVVRDKGFMGSGCYLSVVINGQPVAKLDAGEKVELSMKPAKVILGATPDGSSMCRSSLAQRNKREAQVIIDQGDRLVYRIATSENGEMSIAPTTDQ